MKKCHRITKPNSLLLTLPVSTNQSQPKHITNSHPVDKYADRVNKITERLNDLHVSRRTSTNLIVSKQLSYRATSNKKSSSNWRMSIRRLRLWMTRSYHGMKQTTRNSTNSKRKSMNFISTLMMTNNKRSMSMNKECKNLRT